ncbi:hypothetical protein BLAT2472_10494 [Burkholderia latens]
MAVVLYSLDCHVRARATVVYRISSIATPRVTAIVYSTGRRGCAGYSLCDLLRTVQ